MHAIFKPMSAIDARMNCSVGYRKVTMSGRHGG
jgi:hypothetical protein